MKVLVTGANGLLGQYLVRSLLDEGIAVIGTGKGPDRLRFSQEPGYCYYSADLGKPGSLYQVLEMEKPESVIHAGAMTQVDHCELNREDCFKVNALGTSYALQAAEEYSRRFVYISTDFVFDGARGCYTEEDPTGPVNWYGSTKVQGEQFVSEGKISCAIVRTCLVYGNSLAGTRNNIITWTKDKLEKNESIQVVDDQVRTPTYVEDLAKGILLVLKSKAEGIFHVSGKDILTPYQMAVETARYFGLREQLIGRVNEKTFTQAARRPLKTGFVIDKARKMLGFEPMSFQYGLKKMFDNRHA